MMAAALVQSKGVGVDIEKTSTMMLQWGILLASAPYVISSLIRVCGILCRHGAPSIPLLYALREKKLTTTNTIGAS
jgi:hypothetical protein